jgi:hypothetical protein
MIGTTMSVLVLGSAATVKASPPDVARIIRMKASAKTLRVGQTFSLDTRARDVGSTEYFVIFLADWSELNLTSAFTCESMQPNSPSSDGPQCEYDSYTTRKHRATHTTGTFQVDASTPKTFSITACAASFTNPPNPSPEFPNSPGGHCKTRTFTVI